ncbi:septal ring lytic transglycosylase RlpA family protein [Methylobacterium oxalidis]|uniref:septal ring lytic transglycosylase RlpA family protein n=1 Tax=Methylobacterium oxalidis TaxID=944322 RepID=UPI0038B28867
MVEYPAASNTTAIGLAARTSFALLLYLVGSGNLEAQTLGSSLSNSSDRFAEPARVAPVFTLPQVSSQLPPPSLPSGEGAATANASGNEPKDSEAKSAADSGEKTQGVVGAVKSLLVTPAQAEPAPPPPQTEARSGPSEPVVTATVPARRKQPVRTGWRSGRGVKMHCSCRVVARPQHSRKTKITQASEPVAAGRQAASPTPGRSDQLGSGRAVWYQHAGRTASGEMYNPDGLTAAHRTLPLGTRVRVVNRKNGRSVIVRITDRTNQRTQGKSNYVIDLSRGSARKLGIEGVASVALYRAQ